MFSPQIGPDNNDIVFDCRSLTGSAGQTSFPFPDSFNETNLAVRYPRITLPTMTMQNEGLITTQHSQFFTGNLPSHSCNQRLEYAYAARVIAVITL